LSTGGASPPGKSAFAFPDTLCHSCGAPPRYVTSDRGSVFIYCPVFKRYPPQPVHVCTAYAPRRERGA
jgi:hypothetical protein